MKKENRVLCIVLFIISLIALNTSLSAMQKYWTDEPSTRNIERHDSLTGFDITKYVQTIKINDATHYIEGNIKAYVTSESNLTNMTYELMGGTLAVTQVLVNDSVSAYTHVNGIINIPVNFANGQQFTTTVFYSGVTGLAPSPYAIGLKFNTSGCYTLSNPDGGRYYWPCYDHPWDKALVDQHITVRSDWLVAGQGIRQSIVDNLDGTRTHNWSMNTPCATYVIGFAAAPFVEFNQMSGTIPIQNFILPANLANAQISLSHVPEMISFFSDYYGPYPHEKYGQAGISISPYSAMENQTMTLLSTSLLSGTYSGEHTIAHELGHHWFGDAVTPTSMVDVWLKEGFAVYSEFLWQHHYYGWTNGLAYLASSIQNYYLNWETSHTTSVSYNPPYNSMFSPATYEKGASIIHMMRLKMGSPTFENFVHTWFNTYNGSNTVTTEFEAMAEQVSGLDFTQFFSQWVYNYGIPSAKLTYFSDGISQAKIVAQTSSTSNNPFDIEIPLKLANSTLLDSIVVRATPNGYANVFPMDIATDNLANIQIDPNHWVLNRGYTVNYFQLTQCLPANHRVTLYWNALACPTPLNGYNIYRKNLTTNVTLKLNMFPLAQLTYIDNGAVNGTAYQYYIKAVDQDGFESLPTNTMNATPIDFPFDWGFLVVDETRDGTGTAFSPTDQEVDDFYSSVLTGIPYSSWDYQSMGAPSLNTLSHYPLILWHGDDYSEFMIDDVISTLTSYVISGGKLLVSGWKYPGALPQSFFDQWYGGIVPLLINQPTLVSAESDFYQDLHPDPDKLITLWNNNLSMAYVFPGAAQFFYTANVSDSLIGHGEPLVARIDNNGTMIMLGFPLFYMMETEVQAFLSVILPQLYPNVGVEEENITPTALAVKCYPNPFSGNLTIDISGSKNSPADIGIYNIKGQLVKQLQNVNDKTIKWNGSNDQGSHVSNGIYIIRVKVSKNSYFKRVTLIH